VPSRLHILIEKRRLRLGSFSILFFASVGVVFGMLFVMFVTIARLRSMPNSACFIAFMPCSGPLAAKGLTTLLMNRGSSSSWRFRRCLWLVALLFQQLFGLGRGFITSSPSSSPWYFDRLDVYFVQCFKLGNFISFLFFLHMLTQHSA